MIGLDPASREMVAELRDLGRRYMRPMGLEADRVGVQAGVPTVIDGGTSGVATFGITRRYWDQAAVLSQLGLIDPSLPFADATEIAGFLRDKVLQ